GDDEGGEDGAHDLPRSKPEPQAGDEAYPAGALACAPREIRGLAEFFFVDDAEIGREFPAELVAQAQSGIDVGKAGADHAGGIGLAVDIELDLRLQDQPLRQSSSVLRFGGSLATKPYRRSAMTTAVDK